MKKFLNKKFQIHLILNENFVEFCYNFYARKKFLLGYDSTRLENVFPETLLIPIKDNHARKTSISSDFHIVTLMRTISIIRLLCTVIHML